MRPAPLPLPPSSHPIESLIPVPLPVAPYLTHLPPLPLDYTDSPRCTPTSGRLIYTPATRTHRHLPNLCRLWSCWYCATFRVQRLLELLALHHEHDRRLVADSVLSPDSPTFPALTFHQLPLNTVRRRQERFIVPTSRLLISRQSNPTSRPRHLAIVSHATGRPGPGGATTSTALPRVTPLPLPDFFDLVAGITFRLPGIVRATWSGSWSDHAPDHLPVEIPLRDIPRHLLPSVLDLAVDATTRRYNIAPWHPLSDPLPRVVPDDVWVRELRFAAKLFQAG